MRESETGAARLGGDHREIDGLFETVFGALARSDAAAAHEAMDRAWMRLAVHIRAEHKVLFPALLPGHPGLADLIQELRADHDVFMETLARLLGDLRKPGADCAAIAASFGGVDKRLQTHNEREETQVYPLAEEDAGLATHLAAELAFLPDRYKH
jgi:hemerythrin superfamily protein